ncbi:MAG: deoxynucleoside kinase [candidate division WOR-3 bacterium]
MERELNYIAIEGGIALGKKELAQKLAKRIDARALTFDEENPFLPLFYQDQSYAFQTQIYFLLARYKHQLLLKQPELFYPKVVTNYIFEKDWIYAHLNLKGQELSLYEKIYEILKKDVLKPDLVIYLQAQPETVLERIKRKGRPYERDLPIEYINSLLNQYDAFFMHWEESPLLIVRLEKVDLLNRQEDFDSLFHQILETKRGRKFFSKV